MSHLEELLNQIGDKDLKQRILHEMNTTHNQKKFGLVWENNPEKLDTLLATHTLYPILDPTLTVIKNHPEGTQAKHPLPHPHFLFEGDNLLALTILHTTHRDKIDVIYIDPPYNTGKEFAYNDKFVNPKDNSKHSQWLSFMYTRLQLAKPLLKETGTIFISIDDNEQAHLKLLCDEVFGEENFEGQVVWDGGAMKNNARFLSSTHEYCLIYHKNKHHLTATTTSRWRTVREGYVEAMRKYEQLKKKFNNDPQRIEPAYRSWLQKTTLPKRIKAFNRVDEGGLYTHSDLSSPSKGGKMYTVPHPVTGQPCQPPSRGWAISEKYMNELITQNLVLFGEDETKQPLKKLYLKEVSLTVFRSIHANPARSSTHLLEKMIGRGNFPHPKSLEYIKNLLAAVTEKDSVVLDFFAGSGTTGHAVAQLNSEDGGTRQCILATDNSGKTSSGQFISDAGSEGICRKVTFPRMRAALTGNWADQQPHTPLPGELYGFTITTVHNENLGEASHTNMGYDLLLKFS